MCTNRIDTLDPAILRPGRIDRKIEFPLPSVQEKRFMFHTLTNSMNLSDEVDIEYFITKQEKLSGAVIAAICQEAGIQAIRKNRYIITQSDFLISYKLNVGLPIQLPNFYIGKFLEKKSKINFDFQFIKYSEKHLFIYIRDFRKPVKLSSVPLGPFSCCSFIPTIFLKNSGNLRNKRVIWIRVCQKRANGKKHFNRRRAPLIANIQTNVTVIYIGVINTSNKLNFWWLKWVVGWKIYIKKKNPSCVRRIPRAYNSSPSKIFIIRSSRTIGRRS
eukprot:05895_6